MDWKVAECWFTLYCFIFNALKINYSIKIEYADFFQLSIAMQFYKNLSVTLMTSLLPESQPCNRQPNPLWSHAAQVTVSASNYGAGWAAEIRQDWPCFSGRHLKCADYELSSCTSPAIRLNSLILSCRPTNEANKSIKQQQFHFLLHKPLT